ncbi:MAG: rhodanese-like domain-containing protein [Phycisphaerae bacterium]
MPLHLDLHRACTIALLGVVVGGVHSLSRPISLKPAAPEPLSPEGGRTAPGPTPPTAASGGTVAASGKEGDITLAQARALYQQGVMFVDARSLAEFTASHVEGAVHLPLEALEGGTRPAALDVLDPSAKVVIYCGGGDCHASHDVAIRLNGLGFRNCYVMTEGFPGWKAAGYEVTGGAP